MDMQDPLDDGGAVDMDPAREVEDLPEYDYESDGGESLGDSDDYAMTESLKGDDADLPGTPTDKTTWTDQVKLIHLRRFIDDLAEEVKEKDYVVQKTRHELKKAKEKIEGLEQERDVTFVQIQNAEDEGNTAAEYRLRAQHDRVIREIESEGELRDTIKENLDQAEYELQQAQVEQGKYLLAEDDLKKKEEKMFNEKTDMAGYRSKKEDTYAKNATKQRKATVKAYNTQLREQQKREQQLLNEAKKSQARANKFLERTVTKMKTREMEEEQRHSQHMKKRMETMLALKRDITHNRDNLKAIQARDKALAKAKKSAEDEEMKQILAAGGNAVEMYIKQKKLEEFEQEKEKFKDVQRDKQVDIASRLLMEEDRIKKRMKQQPQLWATEKTEKEKAVKPHKKRKLRTFDDKANGDIQGETFLIDQSKFEGKTGDESGSDDDNFLTATSSREASFIPDSDDDTEINADLAKPEFEGLWDKHKDYKAPQGVEPTGGMTGKLPGSTKMEQDIMQRVLQQHREGIVVKQVAGGKEFSGCPFYSKPTIVHFKDFDVGRTYKKKVILTNVSYSINYCKLLGITEHLKDFIDISFDPPGQMSAGMTCEMNVTFKPMINEDLQGEVKFLAQTGPFQIPLVCTTKKCDLKVDTHTLDYGVSVIGETLKRSFTLTNNGALGTKFDFYKMSGYKGRALTTAETSLGRLTSADTMRIVSPDSEDITDRKKEKSKSKISLDAQKNNEDKQDTEGDVPPEGDQTGDIEGNEVPMDAEEDDSLADAGAYDMDELSSLDGMNVKGVSSGEIGPFSSIKLEVLWQPTIPGRVDTEFVINFSDPDSENITIQSQANAIDVPVWVERHNVDLKICMFDRLYQDTIIVNNRATTALRLKFDVCKELKNHLELLPKTGYIQAQSQFSAQLKFLPRKSLFEDAGKFFDKETGVLEAPMVITVADQTRPVPFTVQAVVTNSDFEFDTTDIDFGHCTIYEATKTTIKLTNKSILAQQFGFIGIPNYVQVQPNDGFGTLLPLETIELDVIFHPKKAREYEFELTCKSLINREFKIKCKGVGVHPPLELSNQVVHFSSTALYDVSTTALHVVNSHTSMNEFSHPVPRIGKGEIAPVGPTSFEFVVPEDAPITLSPSVGTVQPGKKQRVQVRFTPTFNEEEIQKEAVRLITIKLEQQAQEEHKRQLLLEQQAAEEAALKKKPVRGKQPSPKGKGRGEGIGQMAIKGPEPLDPPKEGEVAKMSDEYSAAVASLLRQFRGRFQSYTIPCYVASGTCTNPGELPYSVHNTLYLDVHCPAIKPEIVVISENGRTTTDFGQVSIGQSIVKSVTIQNISDKTLDLKGSCLDPTGPFQMLNALRMLPPDASHTMLLGFVPHIGETFQETVEIMTGNSTLYVTLKGKGVSPVVNLSIKDGQLDMGAVITGEYREEPFKIVNTSSLSVQYSIKLDSQSLLRHAKAQGIPQFIKRDSKAKSLVGTQNSSGQQVFDCVPAEGIIPKDGSVDVMVTFAPDHPSDNYSDGIRIELFGQEEQHAFQVVGQSKKHIMYLEGGEDTTVEVDSLAVEPEKEPEDDGKPPPVPLLVTLYSVSREKEFDMATKEISVGCVRTMAVSQKKFVRQNGEWTFDNLNVIQQQGFNIDPIKGMIEAGTKKPIKITWTPPPGFDPSRPLEATINCTLRGDVVEQYRLMLRGIIVSE